MFARLRATESIGQPIGDERFLTRLKRLTKRPLKPSKCEPKPAATDENTNLVHCHQSESMVIFETFTVTDLVDTKSQA